MHPIFATKWRITLYLLAWLPLSGLLKSVFYFSGTYGIWESGLVTVPLSLMYALVCLSPWYSCRMLPIGPGNTGKILRSHLAAAIVAALFWVVAAKGLGLLLSRWRPTMNAQVSRDLPALFIVGLLLYVLAVSLHYVLLTVQSSREAEVQAHEAKMLAREAELKALKAQINPHFLFNSLNSISALTMVDGARARQMCIGLSDFLRSTLSLGERQSIALSEELQLVKTYLAVEKIRFGARLDVEETIGAGCGDCAIPPLLVQPLVENAIKHGVAGLIDGGTIRIEAERVNEQLHVRVMNEFDADAPVPRKNGLGLMNVQNRLRTRYEHRARLDTESKNGSFRAELTLPFEMHLPLQSETPGAAQGAAALAAASGRAPHA